MALALSPAEAFARPRTRLRWLDAYTILEQFALVTFAVDPARLRAVLPVGLEPEVRTLDDGRTGGFASAVSFRDVDFRFAVAPWLRVSFFQTNYRAWNRVLRHIPCSRHDRSSSTSCSCPGSRDLISPG